MRLLIMMSFLFSTTNVFSKDTAKILFATDKQVIAKPKKVNIRKKLQQQNYIRTNNKTQSPLLSQSPKVKKANKTWVRIKGKKAFSVAKTLKKRNTYESLRYMPHMAVNDFWTTEVIMTSNNVHAMDVELEIFAPSGNPAIVTYEIDEIDADNDGYIDQYVNTDDQGNATTIPIQLSSAFVMTRLDFTEAYDAITGEPINDISIVAWVDDAANETYDDAQYISFSVGYFLYTDQYLSNGEVQTNNLAAFNVPVIPDVHNAYSFNVKMGLDYKSDGLLQQQGGIGIHNVYEETIDIVASLYDYDGNLVGEEQVITLGPRQKYKNVFTLLFGNHDLPAGIANVEFIGIRNLDAEELELIEFALIGGTFTGDRSTQSITPDAYDYVDAPFSKR